MSQFDDYLASVNGVAIDVDGNYGPQCWDLWSHYASNLIGVNPWWLTGTNSGGGCSSHPGFTCGIWYGFGGNLNPWFTSYGPDTVAQPGDVAIWDYGYPATPYSHVAIVVEDRGGSLYTMTQNPGACHYGQITKNGLLGYLRPDNQSFFAGNGNGSTGVATPTNPGWGGTYTVVSGDTLSGIAGNYGISWQDLYAANTDVIGGNPNVIVPSQVLRVPGETTPAPAPAPSGGNKQRVIVPGDTLWDISAQELGDGSRYMEIFNLSNFRSGNPGLIYPGEIAIIP